MLVYLSLWAIRLLCKNYTTFTLRVTLILQINLQQDESNSNVTHMLLYI
jgi:hypothetical protein